MKNIFFWSAFLFLTLLITIGCESFLEEEPRGILSTEEFYNNDNEALLASNGLYRILHRGSLYNTRGLDNYLVNGTDEVGPSRNVNTNVHNYLIDEGVSDGNSTWGALYEIVRNANDIISRVEDNPNISDDTRDQVLGEAFFMRALAYFHLTNLWGDVPYFRELLPLEELSILERSPKEPIRDDMKTDLEDAFNLLPSSYGDAELGRATRWAAKTLQAKFYLFDEQWQFAKDACDEVINGPHVLLPSFGDIFNQEDRNDQYNDELIFVVDFTTDPVISDMSTQRTDDYNPRLRDEPTNRNDVPTSNNPDNLTRSELLFEALQAEGQDMTGFGWAIPLPEIADQANWEAGDLRYDATIVTEHLGFTLSFPYFRKNWNLNEDSPRQNHHENYIVFRLADVYLMAAEAENELNGPTNAAYTYVNTVRERAFETSNPWPGMSQEDFRLAIRDERKFELATEGHRKMDLIRWGILLETVQNVEHRPWNNPGANIQPKHVLLPIPQQELILNPNLLNTDPTNNGYR